MLFRHPAHPGKAVRLAYCLNLHPAATLEGVLEGLRSITLPLRERLAAGREFGVGMYLPAELARALANDARELARLKDFLVRHALDPFTYNAFPYGGFGDVGLKQRVFEPRWDQRERREFTLDVARVATELAAGYAAQRHVSISTHCGAHSTYFADEADRERKQADFAVQLAAVASELARHRERSGIDVVLALEPEPRSSTNDLASLPALSRAASLRAAAAERHLGACVDACHMAVEFEGQASCRELESLGAGIGKLQFSSALALDLPAQNEHGRRQLLALDEPRYLHQVTGRRRDGSLVRVGDLPELRAKWTSGEASWRDTTEWRCHFHVPVDLERVGEHGLSTTLAAADAVLEGALDRHGRAGGKPELHVEIETYTWDVLPREARGAGELVDGLEREYRHVLARLDAAGWRPA